MDFNYTGTFQADEQGAFPFNPFQFMWPCDPRGIPPGNPRTGVGCQASLGLTTGGPVMHSLAYRAHNAGGWSPVQVLTRTVEADPTDPLAPWIEQLYREGITGGCNANPLMYCPQDAVTRRQMAVFLLKTKHGPTYLPPPCVGIFLDVGCAP